MGLERILWRNHGYLVKIKSLFPCRRNFHFINNRENFDFINEREEEGFVVNRFCEKTENTCFSQFATENGAPLRDFRSPYFNGFIRISNICDGLVHLYCNNRDLVWKPCQSQIKVLPPSMVPRRPSNSSMTTCGSRGFGFDKISQDYKVVRFISHSFDDDIAQIELYSYKNDSWEELLEELPKPQELADLTSSAYVDGCCYWHSYLSCNRGKIISFDFTTNSFSYVPLPPKPQLWKLLSTMKWASMLVEWNGCIGMLVYPRSHRIGDSIELWVLGKDRRSWDMKLQFAVEALKHPYWFDRDGRFLIFGGCDDRLAVYDLRNQTVNKTRIAVGYALHVVPCIYSPICPPRWTIQS